MGTKQTGKGEYVFFHFACLGLLPFAIFGCLHFSEKLQGQQVLEEGMEELLGGHYEASMAKSLAVLNNYPDSLADQALFQMGLLFAHPQNPNRNLEKSLEYFDRILNGFPESRLRHPTQLWALFIRDVIDKEQKIRIKNKKNLSLQRTVAKQKTVITSFQKKIEAGNNGDVNIEDVIVSLEKTVDEQKEKIILLQDQIEKLKRVDIVIEEKKQKILQQNKSIEETSNGKNSGS